MEISGSTRLDIWELSSTEGSQQVMVSGGEVFCDDKLSNTYIDLICGVYMIPMVHRSTYMLESLGHY